MGVTYDTKSKHSTMYFTFPDTPKTTWFFITPQHQMSLFRVCLYLPARKRVSECKSSMIKVSFLCDRKRKKIVSFIIYSRGSYTCITRYVIFIVWLLRLLFAFFFLFLLY